MKYGARIYPLPTGKMLIKQTVQKEKDGDYVLDTSAPKKHPERHADLDNDKEIADAIRAALAGEL